MTLCQGPVAVQIVRRPRNAASVRGRRLVGPWNRFRHVSWRALRWLIASWAWAWATLDQDLLLHDLAGPHPRRRRHSRHNEYSFTAPTTAGWTTSGSSRWPSPVGNLGGEVGGSRACLACAGRPPSARRRLAGGDASHGGPGATGRISRLGGISRTSPSPCLDPPSCGRNWSAPCSSCRVAGRAAVGAGGVRLATFAWRDLSTRVAAGRATWFDGAVGPTHGFYALAAGIWLAVGLTAPRGRPGISGSSRPPALALPGSDAEPDQGFLSSACPLLHSPGPGQT
jgi:hypothetical protein